MENKVCDDCIDAVSVIVDSNELSVSDSFSYTPGTILTSTLWNQSGSIYIEINGKQTNIGGSYNKFSPYISSSTTARSVTGCTNTADAQILYYWLERGYDLSFSVTTSDYFSLTSDGKTYYVSDSPILGVGALSAINSLLVAKNMNSADFIAALNYYCGVKNHSKFGSSTGTTIYLPSVPYFNGTNAWSFAAAGFDSYQSISYYNNTTEFFVNKEVSDVGWSVVRENLDYGEVIRLTIPGHSIYLDGYRYNSFTGKYEYHLNYGWGTNSSYTKWYSESAFTGDLEIQEILIDLSPDIYVNVTSDRSDYYGGSFIRGLERINHIQKEKVTTFTFDDSIAGSAISLTTSAALTSAVDVEFLNFNVNFQTTAADGFSSNDAMSFELTDASIVVNNSLSSAKAVYESGSEKLTIELDSSWIYAGYSSNGGNYIVDMLEEDNDYYYTSINSTLLVNAAGYAIYSGNASDTITLTNSSAVFGKIFLGAGANTITVENGSLIYGKFEGSAGTVTVNMQINGTANGAMIVASDAASEDNLYSITEGTFNVKIGSDATAQSYTLYTGYSAAATLNFRVNLTVGSTTYTLDRNNRSAGNYTLVYDGTSMRLQHGVEVASNVKIYSSGTLTSQGSSFTGVTIQGGENNSMHISSGGVANSTTVNSNGCIYISSGGTANSTTVNLFGRILVSSGGVAERSLVNWGSMYISSGGTANNTTVNSYGYMIVSFGGTANSTVVNSRGYMHISSGGIVSNTAVNSLGNVHVSSGGIANNTTVNSYGNIFISSGGTADNTAIHSHGSMHVIYGGVANSTTVNSNGCIYIFSGGTANNTAVNSLGNVHISSGGTASNTAVNSGGNIHVSSGGTANSTTVNLFGRILVSSGGVAERSLVNWGSMYISSGGTANNTTVNSYGYMIVSFGGTANSTVVNSRGYMHISSGGIVSNTAVNSLGNVHVSSAGIANNTTVNSYGNIYISSGGTADNTAIHSYGSMHVIYGGVANSTTVNVVGYMVISSGGTANSTTINSSGRMIICSGGTANSTVVNSRGCMCIESGGTANSTTVNSDGCIYIFSGGIAERTLVNRGSVYISSGGTANNTTVNSYGNIFIFSGGCADNTAIRSLGNMNVSYGGTANSTTINSGGDMHISSGGTANSTTVNACGSMYIESGGIANNTTVNDGNMYISSGGTASIIFNPWQGNIYSSAGADVTYLERDAKIYYGNDYSGIISKYNSVNNLNIISGNSAIIYSGGIANSTTVNRGDMHISSGGVANNTTVKSWSHMHISSGGTANSTTIDDGRMHISSGGIANNTTVNAYGSMYISSGGIANNTTVNDGYMHISSDGTANNTTVDSWGHMHISSGGTHSGTLQIANWAYVYANNSATIDFTVSERTTSAGYLINNLSLVKGTPTYTITVKKNQAEGTYKLAQGARNFSGTLTIGNGTVDYGTITVNGDDFIYDGVTYSLDNDNINGDLTLTITRDVTPPLLSITGNTTAPTNKDVILSVSADEACTILFNIDNDEWQTYQDGITVTTNSIINIKATDLTGNVTEKSIDVSNIDKVAPVKPFVSADITAETKNSVTVSAAFSGDSVVKQYSLDNNTWYNYTSGVVMESNGIVYFRGIDAAGNISAITAYDVNNIITAPDVVEGDLDGNGLADVILVHTKQGYSGAWLTTGEKNVIKWGGLSDVKAGTEILGTGKLYGSADDGQDIFFTDGKTVGAWNVVEGKVTSYKTIMNVNATTNVIGLGDFNGDGATDLLLRSTSGDLGFYGTDGTGWEYLIGLGKEWSVAAVGDLNGDGLADTIVRHDAGFAGTFLTQTDGTVKWANLDTLKDDMTIVGTGDFNGDGVDDVLLQNKSNGWVGAWLVEDGSVAGFMGICTNKSAIEQVADFNGDGIDDLRVRDGKAVGVLYVNGADSTTWQYFQSVGTEWDTSFALLS